MNQTFGEGFWATVELLVSDIKDSGTVSPFNDDIEEWLDTMAHKVKQQRERARRKQENKSNFSDDTSSLDYGSLIECSFSSPQVRSRLELLMGSNVVRLTDRKYMLRLMAKLRQDFESKQLYRIEERKNNELMRTKMMILNRLISVNEAPAEIRQYPLFQLYLYCDAIVEQKRMKHSYKKRKIASSLYHILYPDAKTEKKISDDEKEVYMKRVYVDGVPELVPMTEEEVVAAKLELETIKDIEEGYALTQKEYDRLHYETDAIKELRKTQKVEEMYAKAHDILGILYSYVDDGRYDIEDQVNKVSDSSATTNQLDDLPDEDKHQD
ncbi:uncharacterized protein LOC123262161 [Cotesia glomerata]|uniref:Uncharacterized protein n=1 Tax=Cotesia glomerata TaxID=32391 RepID=A0AAV7J2U8_COTGL|nr:uncharacterized protein LOC123262161 [Cotesia glomerata]KAH0567170.1 hypothetical protein KQX54_007249 [Cotesia glomerata]